jgi:hypothetical protein
MRNDRPDFVTFARKHCGIELTPWQIALLRELEAGRPVVVSGRGCGRRVGLEVLEKYRRALEDQ